MALTDEQKKYIDLIREHPAQIGKWCGYTLLTDELHNGWLREIICGKDDKTIQAHRGSYKTTCLAVGLALYMLLYPAKTIMFYRKADDDVAEVVTQVAKVLQDDHVRYIAQKIWGKDLTLVKQSQNEISTSLYTSPRGSAQLVGLGIKSTMTGKHADLVVTDDIVNIQDRISKAERERTKLAYQELQNIRNRGGRILNTGTPWHKDDAFTLMAAPERYTCYDTGLISEDELATIRASMSPALFAANYELRHVADVDALFADPQMDESKTLADMRDCRAHIDAAYGGGDWTAYTIITRQDGIYYVYGRLWQRHIDDVLDEILTLHSSIMGGTIYVEDNGDKGYLAKEIRRRGAHARVYHERANKHLKISSYLKAVWPNVRFISGTDADYIEQIADYTEDAEHDDAPDSLASLVRALYFKSDNVDKPELKPPPFKALENKPATTNAIIEYGRDR